MGGSHGLFHFIIGVRESARKTFPVGPRFVRLPYWALSSELPEIVNSFTTMEASTVALPLMVAKHCTLAA